MEQVWASVFFKVADVSEAHYGSILQAQKNRTLIGQFPESRAQTAGDKKLIYLLNRKIAVRPHEKHNFLTVMICEVLYLSSIWRKKKSLGKGK